MIAPSIVELFTRQVAAHSNRPLLVDPTDGGERTYPQVAEAAGRWAAWFLHHGWSPGDRLGVVLPNSPLFAELYLGAALCGVTLCPYNPALSEREVGALVKRFSCRGLLAPARQVEALQEHVGVPVIDVALAAALRLEQPRSLPLVDPNAPSVLIMTSGTTGGSKACRLSQANVCWTAAHAATAFALTAESRYLTPLPFFHINAQVIGLLAAITAGGSVAIGSRLPAPKLWEAAARCRATGMSAVPALVLDLLRSPAAPPPSLRFVVCSSAPLSTATQETFEQRFGIPLLFCYGLSEAGCFVSYARQSPRAPKGSVGIPIGCEVKVDEAGGVLVRGQGLFSGYDGDPAATAATLIDGWLHTGDVGKVDPEGNLYVLGRIKEMINRGGEKISPHDLEAVLLGCPKVAEAAVFAAPDERLGEEVAAALVLEAGESLTEDDLFAYCEGKLAEFETPKRWYFVPALPKGPTGKLLRRQLLTLLEHP